MLLSEILTGLFFVKKSHLFSDYGQTPLEDVLIAISKVRLPKIRIGVTGLFSKNENKRASRRLQLGSKAN